MTTLYHLTERANWEAALPSGEYRVSTRNRTLDEEGFIHCALPHQVAGVGERFFADADDLVLLVIDSDRLAVPVEHEAAEPGGEAFPHIYGPLPTDAVTKVVAVKRNVAGRLVLPVSRWPRSPSDPGQPPS